MVEGSCVHGVDRAALQTFMKRVRSTLGHDFRTPLGTIVNYAAVLEGSQGRYHPDPGTSVLDDEELRDLPRRIRREAMQTAEMLQLLLDATLRAASAEAFTWVDPNVLLQSIVSDIENGASLREPGLLPEGAATGPDTIELEPPIVEFAWRAFLLLENSLSSRPLSTARTTVERRADGVHLGLMFRANGEEGTAPVDLDAFARGGNGEIPAIHRFALRLSRDLVKARGGELELCGRLGADAAIYLNFLRST